MRALVAATVVLCLGACKKEGADAPGGAPIATSSTDALWAFAPPDPQVAVIAADGSLAPLHAAVLRVMADLQKAPGGAALVQQLRPSLEGAPFDPFDPKSLADAGLDLAKGFAFFDGEKGETAVLPVADAKKFVAAMHGTSEGGIDRFGGKACKPVKDRYVCSSSVEGLDAAARGGGQSQVAGWPAQMRGNIEIYVSPARLGGGAPVSDSKGLRVGVALERGAATVRVHLVGTPTGPFATARGGKTALVSGLADQQPVGLLVLDAVSLWNAQKEQAIRQTAGAPPLPGGVTAGEIAAAVRGDLVGYALPGMPMRGLAKIGLTSEAPVKKLLGACAQLAAAAPPGITLSATGDRCTVTVDPKALGPEMAGLAMPIMKLDAWVEGGSLVLGLGDHAAKSTARPGLSPFAREILEGEHLFAAWGQGNLAGGPLLATKEQLDAMRAQDPTGGFAVWAIHHLSEFGIAIGVTDDGIHAALRVRTLWANPDPVIAAVQAAVSEFSSGKVEALDQLKKIAEQHPDSPFGHDMQAGPAGLVAPMMAVGMVAAVSIPAFVSYTRKSKSVEASIEIQRLRSAALVAAVEGTAFPTPSAGPTPPLGTCCQQGGKCMPDPTLWASEPWQTLQFSVDDPSYYSYEYKISEDGKDFSVMAYGDLDCDGVYSTYSAVGSPDRPDGSEITRTNEGE
ncbi:MAG TPA: hypothetical protein VMZ28_05660 [Kofleriaceae bacterium]|nr:hypothetical protein [Kofleriaceae bacterium]